MGRWATPPVRLGLSGQIPGKTPETLSERFLEFPSRVRLGSPKHYNTSHLRLPEHFQSSLPLGTAGDALFVRKVVPERASQSCSHGIPSSTEGKSERTSQEKLREIQARLARPLPSPTLNPTNPPLKNRKAASWSGLLVEWEPNKN